MEVALDVAKMAASPFTVTRNRSNVGSGYYIDIFIKMFMVLGLNLLKFLTTYAPTILKLFV
jgi:hypothetical protein